MDRHLSQREFLQEEQTAETGANAPDAPVDTLLHEPESQRFIPTDPRREDLQQ